jgi:hypothetical protein
MFWRADRSNGSSYLRQFATMGIMTTNNPGPSEAITLRYAAPDFVPATPIAPAETPGWKDWKIIQTIGNVWEGARADYQNIQADKGSLRAGLLVGQAAMTAAVTAVYLPGGLESSVGSVSSTILQHGGNALEVGLAGGATSTVAELTLTVLLAGCLKHFKQAAAAFEGSTYETQEFSKLSTAGLMLATGSPGVMLRSAVHTPNDNHAWKGVKTAAILFPVNGVLSGSVVGGGGQFAPEWAINTATNPFYWFAGFAGYKGLKGGITAVRERRARAKAATT